MSTFVSENERRNNREARSMPRRRYLEPREAAELLGVPERVMRDHITLSGSRPGTRFSL